MPSFNIRVDVVTSITRSHRIDFTITRFPNSSNRRCQVINDCNHSVLLLLVFPDIAAVRVHLLVRFESYDNRTDHHDNAADLAREVIEVARLGVLVHETLRGYTEHEILEGLVPETAPSEDQQAEGKKQKPWHASFDMVIGVSSAYERRRRIIFFPFLLVPLAVCVRLNTHYDIAFVIVAQEVAVIILDAVDMAVWIGYAVLGRVRNALVRNRIGLTADDHCAVQLIVGAYLDGTGCAAAIGDETVLLAGEFERTQVQVEDAIREIGFRQDSRQEGHEENGDEENGTRRFHYSE